MKSKYKVSNWEDMSVTFEVDHDVFTEDKVEEFYEFWIHSTPLKTYKDKFKWTLQRFANMALYTQLRTGLKYRYVGEEASEEEGFWLMHGHGITIVSMEEFYIDSDSFSVEEVE